MEAFSQSDSPLKSQRLSAKAIPTLLGSTTRERPTKILFTKDKLLDGIISHQ
jgi:hypothetical protein